MFFTGLYCGVDGHYGTYAALAGAPRSDGPGFILCVSVFVSDPEGSVQSNDSVSDSSPPAGVPTQVVQPVQTTSQVIKPLKDTLSVCGWPCGTRCHY